MKRKNKTTKKKVKPVVLANNVAPRPLKKRPSKSKKPSSGKGKVEHKHVQSICKFTNPFCPAAKGSKWPDGTMGNTMVEQIRGSFTVSSLAAGDGATHFLAGMPYGYLKHASSSGGTLTFGAAYTIYKNSSLFATYGHQVRIVSFGVIIRCIASATNASGLVTLGTTGEAIAVNGQIVLGTQLYDEVVVEAIQPGFEHVWISQPKGPRARMFVGETSSTSIGVDWSSLVVEMSGCPASTPMLNMEWTMNVEFTPAVHAAITALAPSNPPANTHVTAAVAGVHKTLGSFIEGGISQVETTLMSHAENALKGLLDDPLGSIAALFF